MLSRHLAAGAVLVAVTIVAGSVACAQPAGAPATEAPVPDPPGPPPAQVDPPVPSFAQLEAAGATIGEIRIVVDNIFDTTDPKENKALYRAANALHVKTRPRIIERSLLLKRGDRVSVRAIEEAERVLRGVPYLYDVRIRALAHRDGVVDIEVATRDTWTIYPAISLSRSGGTNKSELSLRELNLAGTGTELSYGYSKDVDRSGSALDVANRNPFGNWLGIGFSAARNDDGSKNSVALVRPFYALDARWAAGVLAVDDDRIDSVYNAGDLVAEYRHRERRGEVFGGWSAGLVDGWVRRYSLGMTLQEDAYRLEPGRVPPANLPVDETLVGPFARFELVEDRFERQQNRNQMGRPEYFALGLNAAVQLGYASTDLGSTYDALLYSGAISRGFEPLSDHTLYASAALKGQYTGGKVRRQQFGAAAQYYLPHHRRWLFYASLSGDLLTNPDPSDFLYLGGDNGLRGYPLRYQSGTQRVLLTLEERLYTGAFPWRLIRIGAAAFVDVGRAWGGSNPNLADPGWLANAGLGLRFFSVRTGFGNVMHLDVAFPLRPTGDIDSVQFLLRGRASF